MTVVSLTASSGSAQYRCIGIGPTTCTSTPIASRSASLRSTSVSCGQTRPICAWLAAMLAAENDACSAAASAASPGCPSASAFAWGTSRCPCASITGRADLAGRPELSRLVIGLRLRGGEEAEGGVHGAGDVLLGVRLQAHLPADQAHRIADDELDAVQTAGHER